MVEKAYVNMMDREHVIKRIMSFDENVDAWNVLWEHDYNDQESLIKAKLNEQSTYDLVGKLNPRDSVKGGHTEVFRMHVAIKDPQKESIAYLDVNSLYPYVMANVEFPVGHAVT